MLWQAALVACAGVGLASPIDVQQSQIQKRDETPTAPDPMLHLSTDLDFHFEMTRALGLAAYRGSDAGDLLIAAKQIKEKDMESYYSAFNSLAVRSENIAKAIDEKRHPVSAADAYFKAATYYRSADFFLHGNWTDPRINSLWDKALSTWNAANALIEHPGERVNLQGPNCTIPAIFFSSGRRGKRPTLIIGTGYDGSQEELYHMLALPALQRGINVITYEGPGQPTVRRDQNIGFIPDWEKIVTPVVDYAISRKDVDHKAIGLVGSSFGGYLAPRAAAVEHRLAAVMALDGLYDYGAANLAHFPPDLAASFKSGDKATVDRELLGAAFSPESDTMTRWGIQQGLWSFNIHSPFDWISQTQNYTLDGWVDKIKAPVFVGDTQTDMFFAGQAKQLADKLGAKAHYHMYEAIDGVGLHCSMGGFVLSSQVYLDWFEDTIANITRC